MKTHQQALDIAGDYDSLSDQIQAYLKERGLMAVPMVATANMQNAIWLAAHLQDANSQYRAMFAAAPNPFEGEE